MNQKAKARRTPAAKRDRVANPGTARLKTRVNRKERVLVEFPSQLLERADEAARALESNRSELIRNAVERLLEDMEAKRFERQLADAYAANAEMNLVLAEEFSIVDQEGF